jgi:hypothetical protein
VDSFTPIILFYFLWAFCLFHCFCFVFLFYFLVFFSDLFFHYTQRLLFIQSVFGSLVVFVVSSGLLALPPATHVMDAILVLTSL